MNRFNLTFSGEILPGHDPERVKARLAEALGIDDPQYLQRCFSGETVVLRRDLERKSAAEHYAKLHRLGAHAVLVKTSARGTPAGGGKTPAAGRKATPAAAKKEPQQDRASEQALQKALRDRKKEKARLVKAAEAARREAEQQQRIAQQQREAAEQARIAAEREAKARLEKARKQREAEEQKQREAEEKARIAAEQKEQARLEQERKKREAAEKARITAERKEKARLEQERKKREAAEQARIAAEREEQARLAREKKAEAERREAAARREREKREAEQRAARLKVEQARRKREQAEDAARRKAAQARQQAEEQARLEAARQEEEAQRKAMEEQAISRAAAELAQQPALKPVAAKVRTRLELPSTTGKRDHSPADGPVRRKRQPGEPNLYALVPFRNTPQVRARPAQSRQRMRRWYGVAGFAGLALALVASAMATLSGPPALTGAEAMTVDPHQGLVLLAGDHLLLHDRAGLGSRDLPAVELGVTGLRRPMAFDSAGELLVMGRLVHTAEAAPDRLLRCNLSTSTCQPFSPGLDKVTVSALVVHPLDDAVFVADANAGELLKISPTGDILARADTAIPEHPVLRLDSGLLLMNSALGPAISVFRYEDAAFGRQLDEILLQTPEAPVDDYGGVRDFLLAGDNWWVALDRRGAASPELLRFDPRWQFIQRVDLLPARGIEGLVGWGNKVLVLDSREPGIARFNSQGLTEAPLDSDLLQQLLARSHHGSHLAALAWRTGLALCAAGVLLGVCMGGLYRVRGLVYQSCREEGAEAADKLGDEVDWIPAAADRRRRLSRMGVGYGVLALGLVLCAIGLGVSALQLAALLLALLGPAVALTLLHRSEPGHIGVAPRELMLVDHNGMYHMGTDGRIQRRGHFLMIDDVVVFTGGWLLPAFEPGKLEMLAGPLAAGGVRVDRKILAVKLLQGRHPLALGAVATGLSALGAIALLSLQGLP